MQANPIRGSRAPTIDRERALTIIGVTSNNAAEEVAAMESPESSVEVSVEPQPKKKRPRWQLRILVVLAALALVLLVISRLEPE
jgi:hypothetical protein